MNNRYKYNYSKWNLNDQLYSRRILFKKKETKKPSCAVNVAVGSTGNEVNKGRMALGVDGESEWEDNDDKSMFSNNGGHPKQAKEPYGVSFGS